MRQTVLSAFLSRPCLDCSDGLYHCQCCHCTVADDNSDGKHSGKFMHHPYKRSEILWLVCTVYVMFRTMPERRVIGGSVAQSVQWIIIEKGLSVKTTNIYYTCARFHTGERSGVYRGNPRERDHLVDPGVDGRILRWCSGSVMRGHGVDWYGSGHRQVAGTCECGNEPSGSITCGEFLD